MQFSIKKIIKFLFFIYIVLYSFVWLVSPSVVRHFLNEYLQQHQLVLSDDTSIRYNPFLSHLSIRDLAVTNAETDSVLTLQTLDLEVRLYQFVFDELYVSEFIIDGLFVNVSVKEQLIAVAGFAISSETEVESDDASINSVAVKDAEINHAEDEAQASTNTPEPFPYKLALPKLTLTNSELELFLNNDAHQLKLKSLVLSDLGATLSKQSLLLAIDSEVNQSTLSVDITAGLNDGNGEVIVDLALKQVDLSRFQRFLPPEMSELSGLVSYQANHVITLANGDFAVQFENLLLAVENLTLGYQELTIALAKQALTSKALNLQLKNEQPPRIAGLAQLSLSSAKVYTDNSQQVLAQFESLKVNDINLAFENELNTVQVAAIDLTNAVFSDDIDNDLPPLARFDVLNINQIIASERGLAVNAIHLAGLMVDAQLNEEKVLLNLVPLPSSEPELEPQPTEPENTQEVRHQQTAIETVAEQNQFALQLKQFSFTDDAHIHFEDNSVAPAYLRNITITELTAGVFDNQQPELESMFKLTGKSEKYAAFDFSGILQPFLSSAFYSIKGAFKEVSLPAISPYIKDALQHEIESGQLDLALDVKLTGNELEGNADVLLRGIEFTAADDHEAASLKDQTSVPFNIALGMLKDSDGNVELSLPLSGDVSSPSFGLTGLMTLVVKQATMLAAKDYLITTFIPYASVVSIAITAGEFALKIRVNDLEFPAKTVALQPQHQEFLEQFSALLKEKEDVQVKLCAIATAADIDKKAGSAITDKGDINALTEISQQRTHAFKDYMVEKGGIGSARLLLCKPQIDSAEDAKPRLSFTT